MGVLAVATAGDEVDAAAGRGVKEAEVLLLPGNPFLLLPQHQRWQHNRWEGLCHRCQRAHTAKRCTADCSERASLRTAAARFALEVQRIQG